MELSWTCLIERGGIRKMIWSAVEKRRKKLFFLFRFVWLRSSRFCKVKSSLRETSLAAFNNFLLHWLDRLVAASMMLELDRLYGLGATQHTHLFFSYAESAPMPHILASLHRLIIKLNERVTNSNCSHFLFTFIATRARLRRRPKRIDVFFSLIYAILYNSSWLNLLSTESAMALVRWPGHWKW